MSSRNKSLQLRNMLSTRNSCSLPTMVFNTYPEVEKWFKAQIKIKRIKSAKIKKERKKFKVPRTKFSSGLRNVHACSWVSIDLPVNYTMGYFGLNWVPPQSWALSFKIFLVIGVGAADMNRNSGISIGVWGLDSISKSVKHETSLT